MNYSMIFYIIGWILDVEAALLVPSLAVSLKAARWHSSSRSSSA